MSSSFIDRPIDDVRNYWNARPCNLRHSTSEVGSRRYFDEVEARKYFVEPHIPRFAEFDRWRGRRVLEIGCGMGTDTINFARAGAEVTAVDVSARSLELASRRAELFGVADQIAFVEANAEQLTEFVTPAPYDLIYSFGVIHHSPHPERIIEQIRSHYVRPGTTVKLMVYHRYAAKVLGILVTHGRGAFWRLDELIARHSEAQTGCPVTYSYSRKSVAALIGKGFVIKDVSVDHIFPYRVADYVKHEYVKAWPYRYLPAAAFRWLERRLGWHLCVTAEAAATGAESTRVA